MTDVTRILNAIEQGDPSAAKQLLPLVYEELRTLAAAKMAQEAPGQTMQATGLVHEAYLRLVNNDKIQHWNGRGHFFAAAAEAMRRLLIEKARAKQRLKRGQGFRRVDMNVAETAADRTDMWLLEIDDAIEELSRIDPQTATLVKLRCFAGLSVAEAAETIGISSTTAYERWAYAKSWLQCVMDGKPV